MRKTAYYSEEPILRREWKPTSLDFRKYTERIHRSGPIKDYPSPLDELERAVKESFLWDQPLSIEGRVAAQLVIPEEVNRVELSVGDAWAWLKVVAKGPVEIRVRASGLFYTTFELFSFSKVSLNVDIETSSFGEWRDILNVHGEVEERVRALAVEGNIRVFTQLSHSAHSKGRSISKAVAFPRGRVSMEGLIWIPPSGKGVDSYLEQYALLLGGKAYQYPSLEIENNDVKASHSASLFPIEEEDIFYLQSRGIERKEAYRTLVEGFMGDDFTFSSHLRDALAELEG